LGVELPITVLLGIMFLKETLSSVQIFLVAMVLAGIFLLAVKSFSAKTLKGGIEKGVLIGLAGAVGMGFLNFFTASASITISPLMAIWFPWAVVSAVSIFYLWRKNKLSDLAANAMKFKGLVFGMGVFDTLAWLFFALAVVGSGLSITIAISESYTAIAVLLGVLLNKETISKLQWLGAGLALAASFTLALVS